MKDILNRLQALIDKLEATNDAASYADLLAAIELTKRELREVILTFELKMGVLGG